jgi:cellulose synthase/poly-beta-1,6-N-acetylglucosamine synthase-like glycosyltransferase
MNAALAAEGYLASQASPTHDEVELSVVMPCLNEAETLRTCIAKAQNALHEGNIAGEIIIADNGSTDGSQAIAESQGARVVVVAQKGYGSALMGELRRRAANTS